jgi:hypothetical protein
MQVLFDRLNLEERNVAQAVKTGWVEGCWQQGVCLLEPAYCFKPLEVSQCSKARSKSKYNIMHHTTIPPYHHTTIPPYHHTSIPPYHHRVP